MPRSWQKFLSGTLMLLVGGAVIGWLYGRPDWGLLAAALLALAWNIRHLLTFEQALRRGKFDDAQYGDGIWAQLYSGSSHVKQRSRKHKKRYQRLLKEVRNSTNAMPDGGIVLNDTFEILLCNRAARDLVGFRRKQDRGQRVDNILRDPHFAAYLKSGQYDEGVEIRSPVREGAWLLLRIVPYGASQRLLLIRDVTERRRLARMRREFVANASHELRSPLTVIAGYLDTLADDPEMPQHWRKPLEQMQGQAARMNQIVSELLELSRLEGADTERSGERVNVPALLAGVRKSYSDRNDVPRLEIECESQARLSGNTAEIESVISNLLANAVRHTPATGSVTVTWRSDAEGAELRVSDTGEGIDEQHLPRLTERFYRVDAGRSRDGGGTGLGLAIVKHALGRHDAELRIASQLGAGSTFSCHFPASRLMPPASVTPLAGIQ